MSSWILRALRRVRNPTIPFQLRHLVDISVGRYEKWERLPMPLVNITEQYAEYALGRMHFEQGSTAAASLV